MNAGISVPRLGVVLTGVSGAGKSTVAEALCARDNRFSWIGAVTTRDARPDDRPGAYMYVSLAEFESLRKGNLLLNHTEYRGRHYGISAEAVWAAAEHNRIPLILASPESVVRFQAASGGDAAAPTASAHRLHDLRFFRVFLDAPDAVLNERLRVRDGTQPDDRILEQRRKDREFIRDCDLSLENIDLVRSLDRLTRGHAEAAASGPPR